MPDKRAVCSLTDSIIIDYIPTNTREIIDVNVRMHEDIKAALKGVKGEALVVTDGGVYVIKEGRECHYYPYKNITGSKVSRKYRRGRFEVFLEGIDMEDDKGDGDGQQLFGPDPAKNVVNFPWSKVALYRQADKIIKINNEISQLRGGAEVPCQEDDHVYECELRAEIKRLNEKLAALDKGAS